MQKVEDIACFGGRQQVYTHASRTLSCEMRFSVYLPPAAEQQRLPVLYWLSGLTCTEQNFITKAGAQRYAAEHGLILVGPDTSPRGDDVPNDEAYDLGQGAGFYVNATEAPWAEHYRMFDYVTDELPAVVEAQLPATELRSVFGHSMGGHGALIVALKNPGRYRSVSAFSPIVAPTRVPWGEKAFGAYLGADREAWKAWDACELVSNAEQKLPLLVEQGLADTFLGPQLQPEHLEAACKAAGHPLNLNRREGYDHSYYFISTFIGEHIAYHARALKA